MSRRKRTVRRVARTRTLFWTAALLAAGACTGAQDPGRAKREAAVPEVTTAVVEVTTLRERLELTGSIEPTRVARMASPVEGPVMACPVREGDRVEGGRLLARLGRTQGDDAAAASARAELEREALELDRIEKLVDGGAIPGEELDKALVKVSEARAGLARALERLGDYRISAPWDGIVSKVHVAVGDFVPARATLVELFDPASLLLRFAVPEQSAARVARGAAVTVTLDAYPGRVFQATVSRLFPDIDRSTHTRTVEATVDAEGGLAPGMFARISLTLASVTEAPTVPLAAVVRRGGEPVVFVISGDRTARQRPVELGLEADGTVWIATGLAEGEVVAVSGHHGLRDGRTVRVAEEHRGGSGEVLPEAEDRKEKTR